MTQEETHDAFAAIVREMLARKFGNEFVFDPIRVQTERDLDGEPYLHAYIVFEGDHKKLDSSWTVTLPRHLWPHSEELGYSRPPFHSFIHKSEWPRREKAIACYLQTCF